MYSPYDFRSIIESGNKKSAIKAISREPLTEVIRHWRKYGKDYEIYHEGIKLAISNNRYPLFLIESIGSLFDAAVKEGLIELWKNLIYRIIYDLKTESYRLMIGGDRGKILDISPDEKLQLLSVIDSLKTTIYINDIRHDVGIIMTSKVLKIYRFMSFFKTLSQI